MDPVMVPWITWRYGMQGILYWDMKHWSEVKSPWTDAVTFMSGYFCSEGRVLNGEGSLIYPGSETRQNTGQANVDGPVPRFGSSYFAKASKTTSICGC